MIQTVACDFHRFVSITPTSRVVSDQERRDR
jgi:hypothetical protein